MTIDCLVAFTDYGEDYPEALGLITSKKVDLKPMISHYITMEQAPEAFQWCADGLDDKGRAVTKVMFKIGD